ncbi:hypothetical protein EJ08DRAFT_692630 [Tothia fuscella]|uniref:Uncharacterized protein n=1 Tax=Tothia fuscella TaxID=1048955 RepID=A0A9P4U245_9PEZI|nr:hypothetical protein EJ08DRAFT_692630 [Tothia fuscella]
MADISKAAASPPDEQPTKRRKGFDSGRLYPVEVSSRDDGTLIAPEDCQWNVYIDQDHEWIRRHLYRNNWHIQDDDDERIIRMAYYRNLGETRNFSLSFRHTREIYRLYRIILKFGKPTSLQMAYVKAVDQANAEEPADRRIFKDRDNFLLHLKIGAGVLSHFNTDERILFRTKILEAGIEKCKLLDRMWDMEEKGDFWLDVKNCEIHFCHPDYRSIIIASLDGRETELEGFSDPIEKALNAKWQDKVRGKWAGTHFLDTKAKKGQGKEEHRTGSSPNDKTEDVENEFMRLFGVPKMKWEAMQEEWGGDIKILEAKKWSIIGTIEYEDETREVVKTYDNEEKWAAIKKAVKKDIEDAEKAANTQRKAALEAKLAELPLMDRAKVSAFCESTLASLFEKSTHMLKSGDDTLFTALSELEID